MKIVDVGANVGYYTVKWGTLIGARGELHAFEANPELSAFIYDNITISELQSICQLHACAAGEMLGEATLTFTDNCSGLGTLRDVAMPHGVVRSHTVPVAPLDSKLASMSHADLIKIDVEGYEPSVIAGAQQLIARSPKCAFHLEIQTGWEANGHSIGRTLEPIAEGRNLYVLGHDSTLTRINVEDVHDYVFGLPSGLADLFICRPEDEFLGRVRHFISG